MKNEQKNRNFQYVYFIENHIINAFPTIFLDNISDKANSLEELQQHNYKSDKGIEFKCSLYRFKLEIKQKKQLNVTICLKNDNDEIFYKKIIIPDANRDNYIYDFIFEPKKKNIEIKEPPTSFNFSHYQQFEIYVNYLRNQKIKQYDQENLDLILSTQLLLMEKGKSYEFSFYLMVLLECFSTYLVENHLAIFNSEQIKGIGEIENKKLKQTISIVNVFERKPGKIFFNIKDIANVLEYGIKLFTIIIYFYYNFARDKLPNLFLNQDERNQNYIVKSLIENRNELFNNFKLTKEEIHNLLNCIKDIEQINIILTYNVTNLLDLLSIISDDFNSFCNIYSSDINKKKLRMNIEEIINPSENDNIKEISEKYIELVKKQKESNKNLFFLFENSLLKKYIKFYEGKNVINLIYIQKIDKFMKENIENKNEINGLNEIIHETGLKLSKQHSLKNNDILEFIKEDEYYNSKDYNKEIYRPLDILDGLDIYSFDEQFYINWKEINWHHIFYNQYKDFIKKVCDLIKDMKDFNILYKLFNISKTKNQPDYHRYSLSMMQSKIGELIKNFDPLKCPNFKDDLFLLIFLSDQKMGNIDDFLIKFLHNNLNVKLINEIYITLLSRYNDLISFRTKNIIFEFFTKNKLNKNPETLIYLIKNHHELSENILQNIDDYYIIKRHEFLEPKINEKLLLFKGLLDSKIFEKPEYQNTYYVQKVLSTVRTIQNEIIKGEILYEDINRFYNNNDNNKEILFQRLVIISLNKQDDANKLYNAIDKYYTKLNGILDDLNRILEDFLKKKDKYNIKLLKIIIEVIKKGNLNYYEKNYNNEIKEFIINYKYDSIGRNYIAKSKFFQIILENKKKIYSNEEICQKETEKDFNELSILFEEKGLFKINHNNIFKIYLKSIKGQKKEEISNEINILKNIFEKMNNIKVTNEEEVINDIILLSRKEDIYNVAISILLFIEKLGLKKESFYQECEKIISNFQNSNKKEDIEEFKFILNNFGIKIDMLYNKNSKEKIYLEILLKLKNQPESITFLIKRNIEECHYLQEFVGDKNISFLNVNDILELEECVEFMKELEDEAIFKNKIDIEVIKSFKEKIEKHNNIELLFDNYIKKFPEIQYLFEYSFDKSEFTKRIIGLICKKSKFILRNIEGQFFKGEYYDNINIKHKIVKINQNKLLELRDRVQLAEKVENFDEELINFKNYNKFVERVFEINNIHDILKEMYISRYPKEIKIQMNIENYQLNIIIFGLEEIIEEDKYDINYQTVLNVMRSALKNLRKGQILAYKNFPLLRLFYGRQFTLIYNGLKEKELFKDKLFPLFMLLKSNLMESEFKTFSDKSFINEREDMFYNIERFLEIILKKEYGHFYLDNIYKDTLIKENKENQYKGVYLYLSDKLEKDLFLIYKYLTKNNPVAQTILLCNKETTTEELTSFLFRAILCEFNTCFIVGGIELLEFNKKKELVELLNKLYDENYENMASCLIILYTKQTTDIFKSLDSLTFFFFNT